LLRGWLVEEVVWGEAPAVRVREAGVEGLVRCGEDLLRVEHVGEEEVGEQNCGRCFPHAADEVRFAAGGGDVVLEELRVDEFEGAAFDVAVDEVLPPHQRDEHEGDGQLPLEHEGDGQLPLHLEGGKDVAELL